MYNFIIHVYNIISRPLSLPLPSPSWVPRLTAVLVPVVLPRSPLVVSPGPLVWTEPGGYPAAASRTQGVCR